MLFPVLSTYVCQQRWNINGKFVRLGVLTCVVATATVMAQVCQMRHCRLVKLSITRQRLKCCTIALAIPTRITNAKLTNGFSLLFNWLNTGLLNRFGIGVNLLHDCLLVGRRFARILCLLSYQNQPDNLRPIYCLQQFHRQPRGCLMIAEQMKLGQIYPR